jgi:hypothetical protein
LPDWPRSRAASPGATAGDSLALGARGEVESATGGVAVEAAISAGVGTGKRGDDGDCRGLECTVLADGAEALRDCFGLAIDAMRGSGCVGLAAVLADCDEFCCRCMRVAGVAGFTRAFVVRADGAFGSIVGEGARASGSARTLFDAIEAAGSSTRVDG